jgi:hypothetical protein
MMVRLVCYNDSVLESFFCWGRCSDFTVICMPKVVCIRSIIAEFRSSFRLHFVGLVGHCVDYSCFQFCLRLIIACAFPGWAFGEI